MSTGDHGALPSMRAEIMELIKERDAMDSQIQALGSILISNKNIGMTEPLVDHDGFPRADVDVYQVRIARNKIICLQNDYKALTESISDKMSVYHSRIRESGDDMEIDMNVTDLSLEQDLIGIARVNLVDAGSPAFHAGLLVNDTIVTFGSVNHQNFQSIQDIGRIVQTSQGNVVIVKVKRFDESSGTDQVKKLALIPGPWSGKGLLGCNIVPITHIDR